jgi:hypothetical protein
MKIRTRLYAWLKVTVSVAVLVVLMGAVLPNFLSVFDGEAGAVPPPSDEQALFNGRDLKGWTVDGADVWSVENGVVVARGTGESEESTLWTLEDYEHYEISLSYKMEGDHPDSGVFMGNTTYQVQFGISGSLQRDMTGCIYYGGQGKGRGTYIARFPEPEKAVRKGEWNGIIIRVTKDRVEVTLNGKKVLDFTETEPTRSFNPKGPIGLQLHGKNDMNVFFRDVEVKELGS